MQVQHNDLPETVSFCMCSVVDNRSEPTTVTMFQESIKKRSIEKHDWQNNVRYTGEHHNLDRYFTVDTAKNEAIGNHHKL